MLPLLQGHAPCALVGFGAVKLWRSAAPTLHTFFDALMDPSLQTCFPPAQCETPPFLPLQGVLPASAASQSSTNDNSKTLARCFFIPHPNEITDIDLFHSALGPTPKRTFG